MNEKAFRTIAIFGVVGTLALTLMMMFTLSQVTDTQTPMIADDVSKQFAPALADSPPANVRLTMSRDGKGVNAARVYKLVLRPNAKIASEPKSLDALMKRASECCVSELGDVKCPVTVRCVAELPDGGEKEAAFAKDEGSDPFGFGSVRAVPATSSTQVGQAPASGVEKR